MIHILIIYKLLYYLSDYILNRLFVGITTKTFCSEVPYLNLYDEGMKRPNILCTGIISLLLHHKIFLAKFLYHNVHHPLMISNVFMFGVADTIEHKLNGRYYRKIYVEKRIVFVLDIYQQNYL